MSGIDESPVHAAVRALEHAMRASSEHHHQVAEQAAAARPVAPALERAPEPVGAGSGGRA